MDSSALVRAGSATPAGPDWTVVDYGLEAARAVLAEAGLGDDAVEATALAGGAVNTVWQVSRAGGPDLVVKATAGAPAGLYAAEADGLAVLRERGGLRTPDLFGVGPRWLVLEALRPYAEAPAFWAAAGRAIASLHGVRGQRFGWQDDGWLGLLPQVNTWCDDGHEFFAVHRLLRYLREPAAEAGLDRAGRTAVERLCARLPELVPPMPPVLTHGDLWRCNVVATPDGLPAFIDPAVSWTWAEVDLSMMYCAGGPPVLGRFFEAYQDLRPLQPGWRDRMPVLHLRELLSDLAHHGTRSSCLAAIDQVIRPFRQR